jgi:hypothetical protein
MSSPQLVYGRPINDAYAFSFVSGLTTMICLACLVFTIYREGYPNRKLAVLQYLSHVFSTGYCIINFLILTVVTGCGFTLTSSIFYTVTDLSADTYILVICFYITPLDQWEKVTKMSWYVLFFLGEIVTRALQYVYLNYVWVTPTLCAGIPVPAVSVPLTFVKAGYVILMGFYLLYIIVSKRNPFIRTGI